MLKRVLLNILTGGLLLVAQTLCGQAVMKPQLQIRDVQLSHRVSVHVIISAAQRDLFVPYCGESGGTQSLCGPGAPTHLEVNTGHAWHAVAFRRHTGAVLGGVPATEWKTQSIPAGSSHDFLIAFPKDDFGLEQGQRLRLVIDTWYDQESLKNGASPIRLVGSSFACP